MTLLEAALAAGTTQLGEDGPTGAHYIFSLRELERLAELLREPPELPPCPPLPY